MHLAQPLWLRVAKPKFDGNPSTAMRFGVLSIPTLVLLVDGEERVRIVGGADRARSSPVSARTGTGDGGAAPAPPLGSRTRRHRAGGGRRPRVGSGHRGVRGVFGALWVAISTGGRSLVRFVPCLALAVGLLLVVAGRGHPRRPLAVSVPLLAGLAHAPTGRCGVRGGHRASDSTETRAQSPSTPPTTTVSPAGRTVVRHGQDFRQ
jgi:hypothetical protein